MTSDKRWGGGRLTFPRGRGREPLEFWKEQRNTLRHPPDTPKQAKGLLSPSGLGKGPESGPLRQKEEVQTAVGGVPMRPTKAHTAASDRGHSRHSARPPHPYPHPRLLPPTHRQPGVLALTRETFTQRLACVSLEKKKPE